jgi:hypothetical protein
MIADSAAQSDAEFEWCKESQSRDIDTLVVWWSLQRFEMAKVDQLVESMSSTRQPFRLAPQASEE